MRQLTSSDLDELEDRLRKQRDSVLDAIRARLAGCGEDQQRVLIDSIAQGGSRAATLLAEADLAALRPELAELAAIDVAIKRFEFGAGGRCALCGQPIALARLRADPTVLTCPDCLARNEAAP